jgi:hypothetical protein
MRTIGAERRIHRVFVTRNTEYHVRRDQCVAVRDRRSGDWVQGHLALESRVSGGLRFHESGGITPNEGLPAVGEALFFCSDGRDLVTSPIVAIKRPEKTLLSRYRA